MKNENIHKYILAFFALMGAGSAVSQAIIFREFLVVFYGNELVLGFILFTWLFSIAVGSGAHRLFRYYVKDRTRAFLNSVFIFSLTPLALIPVIRVSRSFLNVDYGLFIPFSKMAGLAFAVIFLPGFLIGFTFPLGCGIIKGAGAPARVYVAESLGSLAGGALFSFILIRRFSTPQVAVLVFIAFAFAIIAVRAFSLMNRSMWVESALFVICAMGVICAPQIEKTTLELRWKTLVKGLPLIESMNTRYQNLALTRQAEQYSIYFNGLYGYSFPDEYGDAMAAHHVLTQAPTPEKVLILGEVTPGFVKEALKQPVKKLTVVYLDPGLNRLMAPYVSKEGTAALKDPRVKIVHVDGRPFINEAKPGTYDLVYVNLPDPSNALINRYYTVEFFQSAAKALKPDGVLALGVTSSENYMGGEVLSYNLSIYRTLKSVFRHIAICPATPSYFFASKKKGAATDDFNVLFKRYEGRNVEKTTFTPYVFEALYDPRRVKFKRNALKSKSSAPVNRDMRPVAYLYNLKLWNRYSQSRLGPFIDFIQKKGAGFWWWIIAGATVLIVIYLRLIKHKFGKTVRGAAFYSVFAVGLTAMGLSVILIYSYQNLYGALYEQLGFLVALFMLGLFIGGGSACRLIEKGRATKRVMAGMMAAVAVLAALTPWMVKSFYGLGRGWSWLFYLLVVFVGAICGHVFPLASAISVIGARDCKRGLKTPTRKTKPSECGSCLPTANVDSDREVEHTAALLDAADHLGGCVGALLLGAFLIPLLGMTTASWILAGLTVSGFVTWMLSAESWDGQ